MTGDIMAKKKAVDEAKKDVVATEREIRRYVKRAGGYRKGLSEKDKAQCATLLRKLGRQEIAWDPTIQVPGYDNPTVANLIFPDVPRKPVT
jgi:hypothetical protein